MFEKEVYVNRRKRLKEKISEGLILILGNVDSPMNYASNTFHFRQDSSFLYLFGLDFQNLCGVIDVDSGDEMIFGEDIGLEDIIWIGSQKTLQEKAQQVGIDKTFPFKNLFSLISDSRKKGRQIHFLPPYRAENMLLLQEILGIKASKLSTNASMELIKALISLRSTKESCEIKEIQKACAIGYEMHVKAMKMAHPGVWEQSIAGTIEGISIAHGGTPSFPIILTQNGETLHNHNHSNYLKEGKLMLVDAGTETTMHYASDFTRTSPVGGCFSQKQREIYEIVLAANNKAAKLIKPDITYLSIHLKVAEIIATGLKEIGLMKGDIKEAVKSGAHALFFPHGLGHMMGLDVHDMEDLGQIHVGYDDEVKPANQFGTAYLRLGKKLKAGYVITNEPGIYFIPALIDKWKQRKINTEFINFKQLERYRDFGGIRLEDDILVTEKGCGLLGKRIPITPDEIENVINS